MSREDEQPSHSVLLTTSCTYPPSYHCEVTVKISREALVEKTKRDYATGLLCDCVTIKNPCSPDVSRNMSLTTISVEALQDEISRHKASGTLKDYLIIPTRHEAIASGGECRNVLHGTPLHVACCDPNGERGESKIVLLFQAAFEAGLSREDLAKKPVMTFCVGQVVWLTPLHLLAKNPAATEKALQMVCDAWPNALFTTSSGGKFHHRPPGNPLCYVMDDHHGAFSGALSSRVKLLLEQAQLTEQGVKAMVTQSDFGKFTSFSALHYCVWLDELATAEDIFGQLLRACPEASMVTGGRGSNWIHAFHSGHGISDDSFLPMLNLFVECVPLEVLVAVLSTEIYGFEFEQTPICIIRLWHAPETVRLLERLARTDAREDPNGRTLLHYAAANILCDGDPHEKAERETERNRRLDYLNEFPIFVPLPPPLTCERQGTRKLVEWLLKVNPRACSIPDHQGRLPLHLALATGKAWNNGVQSLVRAYPEAVGLHDPVSGRHPLHVVVATGKYGNTGLEELVRAYPEAVGLHDPVSGRHPLHVVVATGKYGNTGLEELVSAYPEAVQLYDPISGRLPLHVAIETGMKWTRGVESLIYAYPAAGQLPDPVTGQLPLVLAASKPEADITIIYSLLRLKPDVVPLQS